MTRVSSIDRRTFLKAAGVLGLLGGTVEGAVAADYRERRDELLVGIIPSAADVRRTAERSLPAEARIVDTNSRLGYVTVEMPAGATSASAKAAFVGSIAQRDGVEYVEPNTIHEALVRPNDSRFDEQYAPQMVNAPAAWETTLGDSNVTIAVIDTGVQYDHPDLDGNFGADTGYDFADGDDDPYPDVPLDERHGTHVAGIAAAETNNGEGIAGISNATLLSVRALNENGWGYTSDIADGIQWATDQGANIINLSLGGGGYTETMQQAVSYAYRNEVLLVAAAGNDNGNTVSYPAAYEECLAVSALDPDGSLAGYSNKGPEIELCAPGTSVLSAVPNDGYRNLSGTSMATPVVSGVAALVLSHRNFTNEQLRIHLKNTAVDVGLPSEEQGSGRVDAAAAVTGERPSVLTIEGTGTSTIYRLTVSGDLEKSTANGSTVQANDDVVGSSASGRVVTGNDSYAFSGEVVALALDGDATVTVDGRRIDPAQYPSDVLTVEGVAGTGSRYEFTVDGPVTKTTAHGATVQPNDSVSPDGDVSGRVFGAGRDSFAFEGRLERFKRFGGLTLYLNGRPIDPDKYPTDILTVEGTGSETHYEFAVDGDLRKSTAFGATRNGNDTVSNATATGVVGGGRDSFAFSGQILRFDVDSGGANVYLNGTRVDSAPLLSDVLTVESNTSRTAYELSVSGDLQKSTANEATINQNDSLSSSAASGTVRGGRDSYTFGGDVTRVALESHARAVLDRSERTIIITGPKDGGVTYAIEVSGTIEPATRPEGNDTLGTDWAEGRVANRGTDAYRYTGDLVSLATGDMTVTVER